MKDTLMNPANPKDAWQMRFHNALCDFDLRLIDLNATNPWPEYTVINLAVAENATNLWKHGFSQTEIKEAYERAIASLCSYAAGEEVRR
jgi:hypothetical protein